MNWLGFDDESMKEMSRQSGVKWYSYLPPTRPSPAPNQPSSSPAEDNPLSGQLAIPATYATCVETETMVADFSSHEKSICGRWQSRLERTYQDVFEALERQGPDLVVLVQGYEPHNAVARIAAENLGLSYLSLENTAVSERMLWDNVTGITNHNLAKNYFRKFDPATPQQVADDYCQHLLNNTKSFKSAEHLSPTRTEHEHQTNFPGDVKANRPKVLFLGQVYTDSSVIFGLKQWTSPIQLIRRCVRWAAENGFDFIAKLHPKEAMGANTIDSRPYNKLTARKMSDAPDLSAMLEKANAFIDDDNSLDTYDLIKKADLIVTLNSQAGLEAAMIGKPVVVAGDAFFGNMGFTFDAPSPEYFDSVMSVAINERSSDEATKRNCLARKFAYIFFQKYCREKSIRGLTDLIVENLR